MLFDRPNPFWAVCEIRNERIKPNVAKFMSIHHIDDVLKWPPFAEMFEFMIFNESWFMLIKNVTEICSQANETKT